VDDSIRIESSHEFFTASLSGEELQLLCNDFGGNGRELVSHFFPAWVSLLYDSPLNVHGLKPTRLYTQLKKSVLRDGLMATLKFYGSLADLLMSSQNEVGSIDFTNQWVDEFRMTPVFREFHKFHQTGDPRLATYLLSFCLFGKKLKLELETWHSVAFRDWEGVESKLSTLTFDDADMKVLKTIVTVLLEGFSVANVYPKFGPGKVADREIRDSIEKAHHLSLDPQLVTILASIDDATEGRFAQAFYGPRSPSTKGIRRKPARLKFVPKDIFKSRSICMEPNSVMFVQQALLEAFVSVFEAGLMSRFVNLRDQSLNREGAMYGSYTGDIDTIDLSSASDSVSWALIKRIFPKEVLFYLALSRSRDAVMTDGSVRRLWKFAPMGSALCFPIQCVVFTAVCIYSAMRQSDWLATQQAGVPGHNYVTQKGVRHFIETAFYESYGFTHPDIGKFQPVHVYGDDICVDASLTRELITILSRLGFTVNEKKSFMNCSSFRESCGGYYLRGFDVTPLRYAMSERTSWKDARYVASGIALCNRAGDYGYFNLRRYLLHSVLWVEGRKRPLLFSTDRDLPFAIFSELPVNDHLERAVFKSVEACRNAGSNALDYQRSEARCVTFMYEQARSPTLLEEDNYEHYLYMRWWARQRFESDVPELTGTSKRVTVGSRLRLVWFPV